MVERSINVFRLRSRVYPAATQSGGDASGSLNVESHPGRIRELSSLRVLKRMVIGDDIVSKVNRHLLSCSGDFPKLDAVAKCLCLGARTLRRRLQELGTSYQQILGEVRRELAIEYLRTSSLTVQEIAELLGYSEVTNFRRAFVRWVQVSPYQYRKQFVAV